MKKSVNVVALLVFVATNVFTPFSYAVDDENQISPTDILISSEISEPLIVDDEENVGGEEKDIGGEETEKPNVSVETQNNEDGDLEGNKLQILEELKEIVIDPLLMLDRTEEEIVDDSEEITDDMDEEVSESREIYGTGEHKNVKVEVYAETGAFEETPILIIESLESEKETEIKKAILTYNEDTEELDEEEIEEVAEEKIIEVVAFDIKFLDKEENEVQPREGMVKVEFNFTENEILEETEEHEVKVYHLNDKDEEGNTIEDIRDMEVDEPEVTANKEVEEIKEEIIEEENEEQQVVTVIGDKFSIYTIVQQVKEEGPLAENENQLANFVYGEINIARPSIFDSIEYPIEGFTIMDRNLGAMSNVVSTSYGTIANTGSYGYQYQWGNNYGFSLGCWSNYCYDPVYFNAKDVVVSGATFHSSMNNSGYYGTTFIKDLQNRNILDFWKEGDLYPHYDGLWGGSGDLQYSDSKGPSGIYWDDGNDRKLRQGPCPDGWHIPSAGEWSMLLYYWYNSGASAVKSLSISNALYYVDNSTIREQFMNQLKLPFAGNRRYSYAYPNALGNTVGFWSSSPDPFHEGNARILFLNSSEIKADDYDLRAYGYSVRCFKNTYTSHNQEDEFTITYEYNGGSGSTASINVLSGERAKKPTNPNKIGYAFKGWYEKVGGELSDIVFNFNTQIVENKELVARREKLQTVIITGDDELKNTFNYGTIQIGDYVLMDRNLGATSDDVMSTGSYGYYYQWGNNYGFSPNPSLTTQTQVDVSDLTGYSSNAYYVDPISRTDEVSWMEGDNNYNLWSGESSFVKDRQGPCPEGWYVPTLTEWEFMYSYLNDDGGNLRSSLKLPFAGALTYNDGSLFAADTSIGDNTVYMWTSTPSDDYSSESKYYSIYDCYDDNCSTMYDSLGAAYGLPIRCIRKVPKILNLNANGGEVSQSQIESDNEGNVTLPNATRGADENGERVFEGWFASTGMSEKIGNSGDVISLTGNMTVYAHWAQTITIRDPANPLSGFTIMDRNLGAENAIVSTTYNVIANTGSYGFKYQWGNNYGFVDGCWTDLCTDYVATGGYTTTLATGNNIYANHGYFGNKFIKGSRDYWQDGLHYKYLRGGENDDSVNNRGVDQKNSTDRQGPCPVGYHVPSAGEWGLLVKYWASASGYSEKIGGSSGLYYFSDSTARDDFMQYFKLPFAGYRGYYSASLGNQGVNGYYWSSSPRTGTSFGSYYLHLNSSYVDASYSDDRAMGYSVRCFKNEFNAPSMNTITFDAQGGDVETGSISVVSGSTVNLSGYIASLDGWNFTGWNINSGAHEGMDSITVTGDVTLYAIFSKEMTSNFVLRDSNAASLDETTASCIAYNGGYCIVTAPTLTKKSGYTVDGWSADEGNEITTIFTGGNTFNSVTHYDVPVSITFYQNGNGGTGYEVRTCYKYNGAGSCPIRSPIITLPTGIEGDWWAIGWHEDPNFHSSNWDENIETSKSTDQSYYAQTMGKLTVIFKPNNNRIGKVYHDIDMSCYVYNASQDGCTVETPKIDSVGTNTPEVVGYTFSGEGTGIAVVGSKVNVTIYGGEEYYAHTKKSKVDLVANWDGNNSVLGDTSLLTGCELPEVYNGASQPTSCTVNGPLVTSSINTPIFIGFNSGADATINNDSYNTGTNKLTLTEMNSDNTWYAITTAPEKMLRITYGKGVGIAEISATSGSCILAATYNGVSQTGCNVIAPSITVKPGYSNENKIWTDKLNPDKQVRENQTITLTKDEHYTANAEYEAGTTIINYRIEYELGGGSVVGAIEAYTVEDAITLVNPTWEHHIFAGWTGGDLSNPEIIIPSIMVKIEMGTIGDKKYYANWYEDFNDNGINDAIESHFLVKYTDGVDGETVFEDQIFNEVLSGLATPLFVGTPERAGYDFLGWSPEVLEFVLDDVEYVARWNKQSSGGGNSSGGGGKRLPTVDTHGAADEEKDSLIDENKEAEEKSETEDSQANQQDETKNNDGENSQGESEPDYPDEFVDAYSFSRINGITTVEKIQDAKMYGNLTRIEMAKMLSNYAINVLGKKPDTSKTIKFKDVTNKMDKKYDNGVLLSYQLGIMGINVKNKKFRPNDLVTRAEFATALSRTLFGGEEGKYKSTRKYYEPHIAKLYNEGIINNTDPNMKEKRGYVMIMLMRSVGVK